VLRCRSHRSQLIQLLLFASFNFQQDSSSILHLASHALLSITRHSTTLSSVVCKERREYIPARSKASAWPKRPAPAWAHRSLMLVPLTLSLAWWHVMSERESSSVHDHESVELVCRRLPASPAPRPLSKAPSVSASWLSAPHREHARNRGQSSGLRRARQAQPALAVRPRTAAPSQCRRSGPWRARTPAPCAPTCRPHPRLLHDGAALPRVSHGRRHLPASAASRPRHTARRRTHRGLATPQPSTRFHQTLRSGQRGGVRTPSRQHEGPSDGVGLHAAARRPRRCMPQQRPWRPRRGEASAAACMVWHAAAGKWRRPSRVPAGSPRAPAAVPAPKEAQRAAPVA
jgi:hypothetical protein